ncbi:MAG: phytanoyl-CoA dioxygenase family protein [Sphingomonadaceae bacterium]
MSNQRPWINSLPGVPHVESPFFTRIFSDPAYDQSTRQIAFDLAHQGYAAFDFPDPDFERMAAAIRSDLQGEFDLAQWKADGHQRGISLRVQDAWRTQNDVRSIACNRAVLDLLGKLYGRPAWPFQTLNFPVGTQQHFHTDSVHFSSAPERFMCGVWVALEDIDEDNGPLMYFPGSHQWPIYTNEHIGRCVAEMPDQASQQLYEAMWRDLVEARQAQPQRFLARKGQALIWAANLMHGGTRQLDPSRTRWSQVTHYFFDDCAYFTPMLSDPFYGSIAFRQLHNIATGEAVPNQYAGHAIPERFIEAVDPAHLSWRDTFDPALYLAANPDVAAAGTDPAHHYLVHGIKERRKLRP